MQAIKPAVSQYMIILMPSCIWFLDSVSVPAVIHIAGKMMQHIFLR